MYWNPSENTVEEWQPVGGWNPSFSEQDKIQLTNLFFFFKNKKGCNEKKAEIMASMIVCKQKYKGLVYTKEQETQIEQALQPIFH